MFKPTKKDLREPITVGDFVEFADFVVENVAMKSDLDRFANKKDLERFATKNDLTEVRSELKNDILTSQDKVMKKLDQVLTEQAAISGNLDQYRNEAKAVKGFEKRVERLEAHSGII
ncbi:hypothetical protein BK004_00765 [bacterium CG10_46_32]|nr:MAG: hypothetical protein BK004_00765 [bacterium CG10_46_32]PIR56429.1 MAG: hypothetical protein COU73_00775 [Parcubacteria group bacterium CG10_big_fil_rev_8_21_14_0_10_46_32]